MFEHFVCFVQAKEKDPIKVSTNFMYFQINYIIFNEYRAQQLIISSQMILPLKAIMRIRKLDTKSNNAIEVTSVKRLYKNNVSCRARMMIIFF